VSVPDQHAAVSGRASKRWLRLPRRTLRLRLTILYGSVFLVSGTILLAITYAGGSSISARVSVAGALARHHHVEPVPPVGSTAPGEPPLGGLPPRAQAQIRQLGLVAGNVHLRDRQALLVWSGIALAIMAVASIVLGWLLAGRVLRPLTAITSAARAISASNLHERLALEGPDDELRELGDTFDELLGRLESSFAAQRQFVANASHELRTPLTLERAILEVSLNDPAANASSLRAACERVLAIGEQQEQMIDALLALARSERGLERREPLLLDSLTGAVLAEQREELERRRLRLDSTLQSAPASGDPRLVERMLGNLIDNAIRHNHAGGWVAVTTAVEAEQALVTVSNSGPVVAPAEVDRLLRPFQRLGAERTGHGSGHGLGLSIVKAIATAHGATLTIDPQQAGGLRVEVRFPRQGAEGGGPWTA
jgi:signal transduction histidine kinase